MRTAGLLLNFGLQLLACWALDCPPQFNEIHGVCLHFSTEKSSWCAAQQYCSTVGGELVRGRNFVLALHKKVFPGMPANYWIGLTDFLHERKNNRAGWRWTDGSLNPASSQLSWFRPTEPGNTGGSQDCAFQCFTSGAICDMFCTPHPRFPMSMVPMCQPRSRTHSSNQVNEFVNVPVRFGLSSEEFAENGACSKLFDVEFELDCAVLCRTQSDDWCVSFYFNKATKECRIVLYTDATLDVGNAISWRKFSMKH